MGRIIINNPGWYTNVSKMTFENKSIGIEVMTEMIPEIHNLGPQ
jgi:hypothetical protein